MAWKEKTHEGDDTVQFEHGLARLCMGIIPCEMLDSNFGETFSTVDQGDNFDICIVVSTEPSRGFKRVATKSNEKKILYERDGGHLSLPIASSFTEPLIRRQNSASISFNPDSENEPYNI